MQSNAGDGSKSPRSRTSPRSDGTRKLSPESGTVSAQDLPGSTINLTGTSSRSPSSPDLLDKKELLSGTTTPKEVQPAKARSRVREMVVATDGPPMRKMCSDGSIRDGKETDQDSSVAGGLGSSKLKSPRPSSPNLSNHQATSRSSHQLAGELEMHDVYFEWLH
jgi:hypothetical protein